MPNLLECALFYSEQMGFSVIPIVQGGKTPIIKWEKYQKEKPSSEQIREWWTKEPNANIGIVTGEISNLFVVDVDSEEGDKNLLDYDFESVVAPTVRTPGGGYHMYFRYPSGAKVTVGVGKIKGTDFRGNGGYAIAPPSVNGNGKSYTWHIDLSNGFHSDLPEKYLKKISENTYEKETEKSRQDTGQVVTLFQRGTRDNDLFHTANCLLRGGMAEVNVRQILEILAKNCKPPFPPKETEIKIRSAIERAERKERNVAREVEEFVAVTTGIFAVTDCYHFLQIVTSRDKSAVRKALNRLKSTNIIEKYGDKDGVYRKVETDFEYIKFDEDDKEEVPYPIELPLGLSNYVDIYQGNIILVAGEFNVGKTGFCLNILRDNKNKVPVRYISSEMKKSEMKKRFSAFGQKMSFWMQDGMTDYIMKSYDFHTCIRPDALNIIDYLEFKDSDYTKGAEYLTQIHDKLTTGVAVIAIQKKEGIRMPRSGDLVLEKPRLAISLSKIPSNRDNPYGLATILKCKSPKLGKMDDKNLVYELANKGSLFSIRENWGFYRISQFNFNKREKEEEKIEQPDSKGTQNTLFT